ncbi:MAG: nucleotidyltransferase domain-containing protein [Roseiarcus sp.]
MPITQIGRRRIISESSQFPVAACKRFDVARLDIFGSAARGENFDPARSDADFLVAFGPDALGAAARRPHSAFSSWPRISPGLLAAVWMLKYIMPSISALA